MVTKPIASGRSAVASVPVIGSTVGPTLGVLGVFGVPGVPGVCGIFSPRTFVTGVFTVLVSLVGFVSPGVLTTPVLVRVPVALLSTVVLTTIPATVTPGAMAPAVYVQVTV